MAPPLRREITNGNAASRIPGQWKLSWAGHHARGAVVRELTGRGYPGSADPDAGRRAAEKTSRLLTLEAWLRTCALGVPLKSHPGDESRSAHRNSFGDPGGFFGGKGRANSNCRDPP